MSEPSGTEGIRHRHYQPNGTVFEKAARPSSCRHLYQSQRSLCWTWWIPDGLHRISALHPRSLHFAGGTYMLAEIRDTESKTSKVRASRFSVRLLLVLSRCKVRASILWSDCEGRAEARNSRLPLIFTHRWLGCGGACVLLFLWAGVKPVGKCAKLVREILPSPCPTPRAVAPLFLWHTPLTLFQWAVANPPVFRPTFVPPRWLISSALGRESMPRSRAVLLAQLLSLWNRMVLISRLWLSRLSVQLQDGRWPSSSSLFSHHVTKPHHEVSEHE